MLSVSRSLKSKSLIALGASIGLLASTSKAVVYAEGKERRQKLPIYDDPEPEMVVKEEPTRLDEAIRAARNETDRQLLGMKYHLQMVTNKVVDMEKEAESNIKSVLVKEEEVMPAAIYVVVAGFAGSIFARRRNIVLRFLSPVAFSALAFGYFFPASSNRLIARASQSDFSKYMPVEVQKQFRELSGQISNANTDISSGSSKLMHDTEQKVSKAVEEVRKLVEKDDESVVDKVQDAIQDTIAVAKETVEDVKEKVAEVKKAFVEEMESRKDMAEKAKEQNDIEERMAKIRAEDSMKRV
ncbi:hypothetical protein BX616_010331 [Lobosporangium transversale]|uniref:MICOS complex subunit n=1 Tax=Lobosporangium transversale TaxID=64571 RepID=A0A1Y2GWK1_9FUNG|nr:apolipo protein O-domain-containing protein [Lobosporangium transversale]KAF9912332.1 hypothetical protein BX616_010331 [Lobosporangium transversale]ORZ26680.1 apolipo protein O-domain-containing protein [Lobosporangium transversale]|eukprot:XP_021884443.1 apolipo protein O-domain-containing protein [Lobosporangium transversale]